MKQLMLLFLLITLPCTAFAMEQSFSQQGLKATMKLSPERLEPQTEVQLSLSLSKDGTPVTDKDVTIEVYERNTDQPIIKRPVDVLDGEYIDSWRFEKAGDYRVIVKIADHQRPDQVMQYEVNASVMDASGPEEQGFFAHHFGGKWGWWGAGLMVIMMVPMMILL